MSMHEMSYLIRFDPSKAKGKILDALKKSGMHKGNAAASLDCRHQTLTRWIAQLGLEPTVERMTKRSLKEGWHHGNVGGRPRSDAG